MSDIKVTVWLSTYNQEPYVAQALDSILMQKTRFPFEIVVADDCSTDRTQEIILDYQKKYPDRIITFFTEKNMGGCRKLTSCIDAGLFRGEYLSYLEGDDYWLGEDRLQTLVEFLDVHPEYAAIAHQREMVNEEGAYICPDISEEILDHPFTIEDFLSGKEYSDFGSVFRNYFKSSGAKYYEILHASKNVCDFQDMFIIQDYGPVYVTSKCFGAYRCARSIGATNYNSITTQAYRCIDHIRICKAVELFYQGKYNLEPMIQSEQKKLLASIVEKQDFNQFVEAKDYLTEESIGRDLPEILYFAIRGKRYSKVLFALQLLETKNTVECFLGLIPYALTRFSEKLMGKGHKGQDKKRGYIISK